MKNNLYSFQITAKMRDSMKKIHVLLTISIFLLFSALTQAQSLRERRYHVADEEIKQIYEHFTGSSLDNAIDQLYSKKHGKLRSNNNIQIRFNGGGAQNKLFIGRKNVMEILIKNDVIIAGSSLSFEFICTSGSYNYASWHDLDPPITEHTITPTYCPIYKPLRVHKEAFDSLAVWLTVSNTSQIDYTDSLMIGGLGLPGKPFIHEHNSEVLLYSLLIELPDDTSMIGEYFIVDNIYSPPDNKWFFEDSSTHQKVAPDFQGVQSDLYGSAPPDTFLIAEPLCESYVKSSNSNIVNLRDDQVILYTPPLDTNTLTDIYYDKDGSKILTAEIIYDGESNDLINLGVEIKGKYNNLLSIRFPIELLPQICLLDGMKKIRRGVKVENELNYSTDDIDCVYSNVQTNLKVSGDSVVVGIIDGGLDWMHEILILYGCLNEG